MKTNLVITHTNYDDGYWFSSNNRLYGEYDLPPISQILEADTDNLTVTHNGFFKNMEKYGMTGVFYEKMKEDTETADGEKIDNSVKAKVPSYLYSCYSVNDRNKTIRMPREAVIVFGKVENDRVIFSSKKIPLTKSGITFKVADRDKCTRRIETKKIQGCKKAKDGKTLILNLKENKAYFDKGENFPLGNEKIRQMIQKDFLGRNCFWIADDTLSEAISQVLELKQFSWIKDFVNEFSTDDGYGCWGEGVDNYIKGCKGFIHNCLQTLDIDTRSTYKPNAPTNIQLLSILTNFTYLVTNTGIEKLYKSPYKSVIHEDYIFGIYNEKTAEGNIFDILNIKKSDNKFLNYLTKKSVGCLLELAPTTSISSDYVMRLNTWLNNIGMDFVRRRLKGLTESLNGFNNMTLFMDNYFETCFLSDVLNTYSELVQDYDKADEKFSWSSKYYNLPYNYRWPIQDGDISIDSNLLINAIIIEFTNLDALSYLKSLIDKGKEYLNNIHAFTDYICNLPRRQGYSNMNSALNQLIDYRVMMTEMGCTPEKYPKFLATSHNIAAKNYHLFKLRKGYNVDFAKFAERVSDYDNLVYAPKTSDFRIIVPDTFMDLFAEGASLNHCVGSYISQVLAGKSRILFLRTKEEISKPYYTIEVSPGGIIRQVKGMNQIDATPEIQKFVHIWAKKNDLTENYL